MVKNVSLSLKIGLALIMGLVLAACSPAGDTAPDSGAADPVDLPAFFDCLREADGLLVSAHRGASMPGYPENAIESMLYFLEDGPAMLEVDVGTTSDGVLILMHDRTLDRTTTGEGRVADTSYAEIQEMTLVDDFGTVTDFKVPTLAEAIRAVRGKGVMTLDLKDASAEQIVAALKEEGAEDEVVFIAYNMTDAINKRSLSDTVIIGVTMTSTDDLDMAIERLGDPRLLQAWTGTQTPNPVLNALLAERDMEVNFGTFGNADRLRGQAATNAYRALHAQGLDIIATDEEMAVRHAVDQTATRTCWANALQ